MWQRWVIYLFFWLMIFISAQILFLSNDICSFVRIFGVFIYQIVREFCKLYHAGISACDYESFNDKIEIFPLLMETKATSKLDICWESPKLQSVQKCEQKSTKIQKDIRFMSFILTEVAINVKVWNQYTKSKPWVFWLLSVFLFSRFMDPTQKVSWKRKKKYRGFAFLLCFR